MGHHALECLALKASTTTLPPSHMWQVLFLLQLCAVVVIALVNGLSLGQPATPHAAALPAPPPPAAPGANPDDSEAKSSLSDDVVRSHQLLLMLVVAALLAALLTALWLAMLRVRRRGRTPAQQTLLVGVGVGPVEQG